VLRPAKTRPTWTPNNVLRETARTPFLGSGQQNVVFLTQKDRKTCLSKPLGAARTTSGGPRFSSKGTSRRNVPRSNWVTDEKNGFFFLPRPLNARPRYFSISLEHTINPHTPGAGPRFPNNGFLKNQVGPDRCVGGGIKPKCAGHPRGTVRVDARGPEEAPGPNRGWVGPWVFFLSVLNRKKKFGRGGRVNRVYAAGNFNP